jgi:hypothetical protein
MDSLQRGALVSGPGDAWPAVVRSGPGGACSRYTGPALGTVVVFAVAAASCTSRQAVGPGCSFDRGGLVAVLAKMNTGAPNTLLVRDASSRPVEECPTDRALVTAPSRGRVEFRRRCDGGIAECFALLSIGPESLTPSDLDAIAERVKAVESEPVLSIFRHYDEVVVLTGSVCGDLCGRGHEYHLRRSGGTWEIVCGESWVS